MLAQRRVTFAIAIVLTVALGSSAAYAWGRITQSDGTVLVCVNRSNGSLRAVSSTSDCKSQEELVALTVGAPIAGATGPTGPAGDTGATGATGDPGATGATGATGPAGATGANGAAGADGQPGAAGATGPQGPVGATGAGSAGATGAAGAPGTTGQNAFGVDSTAAITLSPGVRGPMAIPGLSATFDTAANSVVVLQTEGVIVNNGLFPGDYVQVGIRVRVDGITVADRNSQVEMGSFAFAGHWNVETTLTLSPGTHTVLVDATLRDFGTTHTANPTATIGGMPTSVTKGTLNVLVLNK